MLAGFHVQLSIHSYNRSSNYTEHMAAHQWLKYISEVLHKQRCSAIKVWIELKYLCDCVSWCFSFQHCLRLRETVLLHLWRLIRPFTLLHLWIHLKTAHQTVICAPRRFVCVTGLNSSSSVKTFGSFIILLQHLFRNQRTNGQISFIPSDVAAGWFFKKCRFLLWAFLLFEIKEEALLSDLMTDEGMLCV